MRPELVARIAADTRTIGDRLDQAGVDDAHEAAERLVRWMQSRGWRLHLELADAAPPRPRQADPAVQQQAMAEIRAVLERNRDETR